MRLATSVGNAARQEHILASVEHPSKRIARKRARGGLSPRHNHSRVESSREGHRDYFTAVKIPRKILREDPSNFLIVGFWLERCLLLPFLRLEVRTFLLQRAFPEIPL